GGRLLGAFFWWRQGTRQRGVHSAVRIGRVFAYLMIAFGVFLLFTGSVLNGIWIAFVGLFLLSAGSSEEAGTTIRGLLRSVPVSEVPPTRPDEDLAALLQRIGPGLEQRVLVFDKGQLVGIVSPADVARLLAVRQTLGTSAKPPATTASRRPL